MARFVRSGPFVSNVSLEHEAPLEVLRKEPGFVVELLQLAGVPVHGDDLSATSEDSELTVAIPSSRRADMVSILVDRRRRTRRVVVVEVQRARDEEKLRAWPLYVAHLAFEHEVPATLIVIAFDRAVARWARLSRAVGPNMVFTPLVIAPDDLPEIRSGEEALAHPALAALTALARLEAPRSPPHRARDEQEVLRICEAFLQSNDDLLRNTYVPMIHGTASAAFRATIHGLLEAYGMGINELLYSKGQAEGEALGEARGQAEGEARGEARGQALGRAEVLLGLLRRRGFEFDHELEQRVRKTTDVAALDLWLARVLDAPRLEDVFVS